mmetsp:Transcript_10648/g.23477  ORF Transcript_10648/g.23477 Transcript_10648/m.23477 type:complete len:413 (-) Transcript_10648:22-1260(-)
MAPVKDGAVVVCGGAVMDCIVKPFDKSQRGASRTSMPGAAKLSLGGVGRNMAETVARLGLPARLMSAVGADEAGEQVMASAGRVGMDVKYVDKLQEHRTATFTALLDGAGDLVGAVADMDIFEEILPPFVERTVREGLLEGAALVVADANLPAATLDIVRRTSAERGIPAWFEPVSVAKGLKGFPSLSPSSSSSSSSSSPSAASAAVAANSPWHLISPNLDELQALLGVKHDPNIDFEKGLPTAVLTLVEQASAQNLAENLLLTMGRHGVLLGSALPKSKEGASQMPKTSVVTLNPAEFFMRLGEDTYAAIPPQKVEVTYYATASFGCRWYRLLLPLDHVVDTTGAGDALIAGTAAAFAKGWKLEEALLCGLLCAHVTLFVEGANVPFFTEKLMRHVSEQLKSSIADPTSKL